MFHVYALKIACNLIHIVHWKQYMLHTSSPYFIALYKLIVCLIHSLTLIISSLFPSASFMSLTGTFIRHLENCLTCWHSLTAPSISFCTVQCPPCFVTLFPTSSFHPHHQESMEMDIPMIINLRQSRVHSSALLICVECVYIVVT